MREAGDEHRETEGARTALVPFVNDLEREHEKSEEERSPEARDIPPPQHMRRVSTS